jgi:Mrp family chromosome partitioning ATPase
MTAPRGAAPMVPVAQARVTEPAFKPFVDQVPAAVREPETVVAPGIVPEPAPVAVAQPVVRDTHPELAAGVSEIEQLAQEFRAAGKSARKITILGTGHNDNITLTALTLSRILSRDAKVVLVDLASSSPTLEAVSNDPRAPGLAELMLGEASFGQVITKDRMSGLHMVAAGRAGADRSLLQSPRLTMALDALLRVYDHVLLDAGTAADLPAGLLTDQARAVVVPEVTMSMDARQLMAEQLKAVGFADVKMLRSAPPANDPVGPGGRVFAA